METQGKSVRWATMSLLLVMAAYAMSTAALGVLINELINQYGLEGSAQGLMGSLMQVGNLLGAVILLLVQHRVKKIVLLGASGIFLAASLVMAGLSAAFSLLLAAYLLMGLAGAVLDTLVNGITIDIHPGDSGRYMGALHGWYSISSILTPLLLQVVLLASSWRGAYLFLSLPMLAASVQVLWMASKNQRMFGHGGSVPQTKINLPQVKAYFTSGYNWAINGALTFYAMSQFGLTTWVVRYMAVRFGDEALGAMALSGYWLCATASRFVVPRMKQPPLLLVSIGLALGTAFHILGVAMGSPAAMVVACALIGAVSGPTYPMLLNTGMSRYMGNTSLPASAMLICSKVGLMLLPLALGAAAVASISFSMMLGGFCMLIALPLTLLAAHLDKKAPAGETASTTEAAADM